MRSPGSMSCSTQRSTKCSLSCQRTSSGSGPLASPPSWARERVLAWRASSTEAPRERATENAVARALLPASRSARSAWNLSRGSSARPSSVTGYSGRWQNPVPCKALDLDAPTGVVPDEGTQGVVARHQAVSGLVRIGAVMALTRQRMATVEAAVAPSGVVAELRAGTGADAMGGAVLTAGDRDRH